MHDEQKHRPIRVLRRAVDGTGNTTGAIVATDRDSVTDFHDIKKMHSNYVDNYDYEFVDKDGNVNELIIVHRGNGFYFRSIWNGKETDNFGKLETEIRE